MDKLHRAIEAFLANNLISLTAQSRAAFINALEMGNVGLAADIVMLANVDINAIELQTALRQVVASGAAVVAPAVTEAAIAFGAPKTFRVALDMLNPRTASFIKQYEMNLIKQISDGAREAVRGIVEQGLVDGVNPHRIAVQVRQQVGLTANQTKWVANFRKELETFHLRGSAQGWNLGAKIARTPGGVQAFPIDAASGLPKDMILERRLRDFRFDKTLIKAMKTGNPLTPKQIDKMVGGYTRKLRAWRSRMIARTEYRRAQEVGNHQIWQQAVDDGLFPEGVVRRYWITARDERVRLSHRPIPGMNPKGVGLNETFLTPHGPRMSPPLAPNCRCGVIYRALEPGMDPGAVAPQTEFEVGPPTFGG